MKLERIDPPREFPTGRGQPIVIRDCARIELAPDEQVTFVTEAGGEYDVTRKSWGFYATPSLNGRLLGFGLRAALVRSVAGKYYVFLVERGHEAELEGYLARERNWVVRWLDATAELDALEPHGDDRRAAARTIPLHCPCGEDRYETVHTYFAPPSGELPLAQGSRLPYRRELFRCTLCGHYVSAHDLGGAGFYRGGYVDATYGDAAGIARAFARIQALPADRSDNAGRVERVAAFARARLADSGEIAGATPRVLDVGSGLGVFLDRMQHLGFACTALDPDPRAAAHARDAVGVEAVCADVLGWETDRRFDLVTFNKVLEHVADPAATLRGAARLVEPRGLVYVELPDGEAAAREGFGREEFFVEHLHVFSPASVALLATRSGYDLLLLERLREPSTKHTIRAFLAPRATAAAAGGGR